MNRQSVMPAIKLSICIATRNRGAFIGETLDSLITQATEIVEIVIVDGASTDDTAAVVQQYQARFPRLRYERRPVNGGVDKDYCRTVELAEGQYCWFMTDDDTLKPGAIRTVLDHLDESHSLIVVNAENRTVDQAQVIQGRRLNVDSDRVYRPGASEVVFTDLGHYLTYIGCVVIERALWMARDKQRYWGTWFVHFGVIFQQPLPGSVRVVAKPLINGRIGNISWSERSFEIWMFRWPELVWSMPFSAEAKTKITLPRPWHNLKALLVHRGDGSYTQQTYRRWMAPHPLPARFRLTAALIAKLPVCLVWLLVYVYFQATPRHTRTELYHWLHVPVARRCFPWLARPGPQ